jgi:hypothetical protein
MEYQNIICIPIYSQKFSNIQSNVGVVEAIIFYHVLHRHKVSRSSKTWSKGQQVRIKGVMKECDNGLDLKEKTS